MPPRFLLTGFKPFGGLAVNPTEQLMHAIAGWEENDSDLESLGPLPRFRALIERLRRRGPPTEPDAGDA